MTDLIPRDAAIAAVYHADSFELSLCGTSRIEERIELIPTIDPAAIREAALLDKNGDLIGHPLEMQLRSEWGKIAKHHSLPNDGVVEADLVRAILALIGEKK